MADMKPLPDRDPARATLAAAIAMHADARHDLKVAEEAAGLAASRYYDAQSKLEALRKAPDAPSGSLADSFIASVSAGNPCNVAVLERASVEARAKMTAAENDVNVWKQTHEECDLAVRAKRAAVAPAKERVKRAARIVLANSGTITRLMDGLEAMQAEIINRRVALRYILFSGLNGELAEADRARIEDLFKTDRLPAGFNSAYNSGWEQHQVHQKWDAALDALMTDAEAALPTEFARVA
jgi:hypothetical protein